MTKVIAPAKKGLHYIGFQTKTPNQILLHPLLRRDNASGVSTL
ncbi:MAG: hypothetical protein R2822_26175 [Spirosomataceae bacterium]